MRTTAPCLAVLFGLLLAGSVHAICPTETIENVRNSFRGAEALCHNLSLETATYSSTARTRMTTAAASFLKARQRYDVANVVGALAVAAKGIGQTFAAGHADAVLLLQLGPIRVFMADSVGAFLRCTLDDLVAQHPKEAARAEEFYARAVAAHQQENFTQAVKLYRKGFKKVKAFLAV